MNLLWISILAHSTLRDSLLSESGEIWEIVHPNTQLWLQRKDDNVKQIGK